LQTKLSVSRACFWASCPENLKGSEIKFEKKGRKQKEPYSYVFGGFSHQTKSHSAYGGRKHGKEMLDDAQIEKNPKAKSSIFSCADSTGVSVPSSSPSIKTLVYHQILVFFSRCRPRCLHNQIPKIKPHSFVVCLFNPNRCHPNMSKITASSWKM
jgi:hypothetical protein